MSPARRSIRSSTAKIEELTNEPQGGLHHRLSSLTICSRPRASSDFTAFMYLGELVEFDSTSRVFTALRDKRTQDYITGRFG